MFPPSLTLLPDSPLAHCGAKKDLILLFRFIIRSGIVGAGVSTCGMTSCYAVWGPATVQKVGRYKAIALEVVKSH